MVETRANRELALLEAELLPIIQSASRSCETTLGATPEGGYMPFSSSVFAADLYALLRIDNHDQPIEINLAAIKSFFADKQILVVGGHEGFVFAELGAKKVVMCDPRLVVAGDLPTNLSIIPTDFMTVPVSEQKYDLAYTARLLDTGNEIDSKLLPSPDQILGQMMLHVADTGYLLCNDSELVERLVGDKMEASVETMAGVDIQAHVEHYKHPTTWRRNQLFSNIHIVEKATHPEIANQEKAQEYVSKRVYYLYPFARTIYQVFFDAGYMKIADRLIGNNEFVGQQNYESYKNGSVIRFETSLRQLILYYARVLRNYQNFNPDKEDRVITDLLSAARGILGINSQNNDSMFRFLSSYGSLYSGNRFTASDGYIESHVFGSITSDQFISAPLVGEENKYRQYGAEGFLMIAGHEKFTAILNDLVTYIQANRNGKHVLIWSNNIRGMLDAAIITSSLIDAGIPCTLLFYRASTNAFADNRTMVATPPPTWSAGCWNIAVDSQSITGGSMAMTQKLFEEIGSSQSSMFISLSTRSEAGVNYQNRVETQERPHYFQLYNLTET